MKRWTVGLLGTVAMVVVSVDVAGLAGAFAEPALDSAARSIPKDTPTPRPTHPKTSATSPSQSPTVGGHHPPAAPPSRTATPSSRSTSPSISPSSSASHLPPAVPVPPGALPTAPIGNGAHVTAIGDSVMVDAQPYLVQLLPGIVVDGQISRQLIQTPPVVSALKKAGSLHRDVVIELGTNGPFTATQLRSLLRQIGPHHAFVLVNTSEPRPWETAVNAVIDQVAATYPHTVLVNWYQAAPSIARDFYPDEVHLKPAGAKFYATLIAKAVLTLQKADPPPRS